MMKYEVLYFETRKYVVPVETNNVFNAKSYAMKLLEEDREKYFVETLEDHNVQVYEKEREL